MRSELKVSIWLCLLIVATLFSSQLSSAATYIIRPEDHSVQIDQLSPDENMIDKTGMVVASAPDGNARIVIHFDLSGWAADSISQAKLYLWHWRGGGYTGSRTVDVYSLTSAFHESTATWRSPWSVYGGDYDEDLSASADVPEAWGNWVGWEVSDIIKNRWNNITTYGFLLRDPAEDSPDEPYIKFHSHREDSLPYLEVVAGGTGVEDAGDDHTSPNFWLGQNYPNPFNSTTHFEFELSRTDRVELVIYNIRGQRVKTLLNGAVLAGNHLVNWDGTDQSGNPVSSGVYLYRLCTGNYSQTRELLYLK
jgi:hypothetical protein